jgi:flagellar protein FliL
MAATPAPAAKPAEAAPAAAAAAPSGGGFAAWLPLIANIVLMPVLAWATVNFLILPKMRGEAAPAKEAAAGEGAAGGHGEGGGKAASSHEGGKGKLKPTAALSNKVIVNVSGTQGTRYLLANLTLVGASPGLEEIVKTHDAELREAAGSLLSVKTIADLEKPGARNLIRTELMSAFNNILGNGVVTDIYLTEFAIQ